MSVEDTFAIFYPEASAVRSVLPVAYLRQSGQPDADRRRLLAGLRDDRQRAGPRTGGARAIFSACRSDAGRRPCRRPLRPQDCDLHQPGRRRARDGTSRARHLGRLADPRRDPGDRGDVRRRARVPAANAAEPACRWLFRSAMLSRAIAASSSSNQIATIVGPAIGGVLLAVSIPLVYVLCALLYFAAATLSILLKAERAAQSREPVTFRTLFAGIGFIRRRPVILGSITLDLFAVVLGGATALLPIYAKDIFETGPEGLGSAAAFARHRRAYLLIPAGALAHPPACGPDHVCGGRGFRAFHHRVRRCPPRCPWRWSRSRRWAPPTR